MKQEEGWRKGCFCHVLQNAAAKIVTACLKGSGEVRPLEDMEDPEMLRIGTGLYLALMETAETYMGCQRREGAAMCQKQEESRKQSTVGNEDNLDEDIQRR